MVEKAAADCKTWLHFVNSRRIFCRSFRRFFHISQHFIQICQGIRLIIQSLTKKIFYLYFFLPGFSFMDAVDLQDSREGTILVPSAISTRSLTLNYKSKSWRKYTVGKYQFKVINEDLSTTSMDASVYTVEFEQIFSKTLTYNFLLVSVCLLAVRWNAQSYLNESGWSLTYNTCLMHNAVWVRPIQNKQIKTS